MTGELILIVINSAGVIIVAAGLYFTWHKNGKEQKLRDEKMAKDQHERDVVIETSQKTIIARLDDPNFGLSAINQNAADMKTHCAQISTALCGRVDNLESDVKELKSSRSRS